MELQSNGEYAGFYGQLFRESTENFYVSYMPIKAKKMKTKKIPLVIYTVIVAGLTILGTRLYDSVSDTTDPAIANGPFWAGLCVKTDSKDGMNELICSNIRIFVKAEDYDRSVRKRELSGILND